MKNGTYTVSFEVNLQECITEDDAKEAILSLLLESLEGEEEFPEVNFELTEEEDPEYYMEEPVEELEFGEVN